MAIVVNGLLKEPLIKSGQKDCDSRYSNSKDGSHVTPRGHTVARLLRKFATKMLIIVNHKADNNQRLDTLFSALSDPTRREMLKRLSQREMSVTELAEPFDISKPAILDAFDENLNSTTSNKK